MEPVESTPQTTSPLDRLQQAGTAINANRLFWIVLCITLLVALWFRSRLDFSGGHMDEYDYLFVGRNLLAGQTWPSYQYVFGADFNWYLFGYADRLFGGLEGARSLSALLGVVSLAGVYWFTHDLWRSHRVAALAVVLLAMQASHVFISRLATYDIISFTLLVLSLAPLLKAGRKTHSAKEVRWQTFWLLLGMALLLGAVLAKYTTVVYLPLLAMLMLYKSPRAAILGVLAGSVVIALYLVSHWNDLVILFQNQIAGTHGANTTGFDILQRTWQTCGLLLVLWVFSLLMLPGIRSTQRREIGPVLILLLLFASPLFLYHWHGKNLISLYKHLVFACLFLAPAVAWGLITALERWTNNSATGAIFASLAFAVFMISYALLNASRLQDMQQGFPDVSALVSEVSGQSLLENAVLSEDPYLFRYLGFGLVPQSRLKETSWLDNDGDGHHSLDDVKDALWDRKFGLVLLNDQIHPLVNAELRKVMQIRGYRLLYDNPYQLSNVMTANTQGALSLYERSEGWSPAVATVEQVTE